jgi:hypothetical protein
MHFEKYWCANYARRRWSLPDRHDWHGPRLELLHDEGDYFRRRGRLPSPRSFCERTVLAADTLSRRPLLRPLLLTAKQAARQPREGGANMMWTILATPRPSRTSAPWFLQLSDCSSTRCYANGFPAQWRGGYGGLRRRTPEWTRSTTVMPSLTIPSLTMID